MFSKTVRGLSLDGYHTFDCDSGGTAAVDFSYDGIGSQLAEELRRHGCAETHDENPIFDCSNRFGLAVEFDAEADEVLGVLTPWR